MLFDPRRKKTKLSKKQRQPRSRGATSRPSIEYLEERTMPAVLFVTTTQDGVSGSLRDAITKANTIYQNEGNGIGLAAGTYGLTVAGAREDLNASGDLDIRGKNLLIQGAGAGLTIIDANGLDRVFQIVGPGTTLTLMNLTIRGGLAQDDGANYLAGTTDALGGGVLNRGDLILSNVTFSSNTARGANGNLVHIDGFNALGGGVYSSGGTVTATYTQFLNNSAISGNGADGFTGANGADAASAYGNASDGDPGNPAGPGGSGGTAAGGGLYANNATVTITNSQVQGNVATAGKGGDGGRGGNGGKGGYSAIGAGGDGGAGGQAGVAGLGGNASGGGIAFIGGSLTAIDVRVDSNIATSGKGGNGGAGGAGGSPGRSFTISDGLSEYTDGGQQASHTVGADGGRAAGGGIYTQNATVTLRGTTSSAMSIANNAAIAGAGGAGGTDRIYSNGTGMAAGRGGDATGGGFAALGGMVSIVSTQVFLNQARGGAGGGGGVGGEGDSVSAGDDTNPGFEGGKGGNGGGAAGGGIYAEALIAPLLVDRSWILDNTVQAGDGGAGGGGGHGGGAYPGSIGFVSDGADAGDGGDGGDGGFSRGGGIASLSPTTIVASTISNNRAGGGNGGNGGKGAKGGGGSDGDDGITPGGDAGDGSDGGDGGGAGFAFGAGVYIASPGNSTLTNVTVANNSFLAANVAGLGGAAGPAGRIGIGGGALPNGDSGDAGQPGHAGIIVNYNTGGGVYLNMFGPGGTAVVNHATIVGNSAYAGGGFVYINGSVSVYNTILWQNTGIGIADIDTSNLANHSNNLIGINPMLSILQDNHGPTPTMRPSVGSPAINAGSDTVPGEPATDQRGFFRKIGAHSDIGAVENAVNYFTFAEQHTTQTAAGTDIVYRFTFTLGDDISLTQLEGYVALDGAYSANAQITDVTVPTGWTSTLLNNNGAINGYRIQFSTPPVLGVYEVFMTVRVGSSVPGASTVQNFVSYRNSISALTTQQLNTTIQYATPVITSVAPTSTPEGYEFQLVISGTEFSPAATVRWNGTTVTAIYLSPTYQLPARLVATIPAGLIESGAPASVTVENPGVGISNAMTVSIDNVAPIADFPDRAVMINTSTDLGLINIFDPSAADTSAGFHYSYSTTLAGLANSYATAIDPRTQNYIFASASVLTLYARVFDRDGGSSTYVATIRAQATNVAPVLSGANDLPTITEDMTDNGTRVSDLIAGHVTDGDAGAIQGIAVTGKSTTNGTWQFSTNGGLSWSNFGTLSDSTATLLSAASPNRVRFIPNGQVGTTATLTFRAWDLTNGLPSGRTGVNVTGNGGTSPYSLATATANLIVTDVNDAPVPAQDLLQASEDTPLVIPIASLLANDSVGAGETGQTLTLTAVSGTSLFGGTVVISGSDLIYTPPPGFRGSDYFTFTVRDNGTTNGLSDPRESPMGFAYITVVDVNDPPIAVDDTRPRIQENASPFFIPIADLLANDSTGAPDEILPLTMVSVGNEVGGTALILGNQVQFTPTPGFIGIASFEYTITDNGTSNGLADPRTATATVRFVVAPTNPIVATSIIGATTWGDFDADGRLDILAIANGAAVFHNDGTSFSTASIVGMAALSDATGVWGDFDNDGTLEFLLSGRDPNAALAPVVRIYKYQINGSGDPEFVLLRSISTTLNLPSASWADIDNDGDLDVLITGQTLTALEGHVLRNDGGVLSLQSTVANAFGAAAWGDYDQDGDLDFATTYGAVYRNTNGTFTFNWGTSTPTTIAAWGDYDGDGALDLLLSDGIYKNFDNLFGREFTFGTQAVSGAWLDFDNDGRLDAVISTLSNTRIVSHDAQAGTFSTQVADDFGAEFGPLSAGDYDRDGDPDVQVGSNLYLNYGARVNSPPAAPTGLSAVTNADGSVTFSWVPPADDRTDTDSLSYSLRIGTTPGGSEVLGALVANGHRQLAQAGAIQDALGATTWTIRGLTHGVTYYWSVQAIDVSFVGSAFAAESSFLVNVLPVSNSGGFSFPADTDVAINATMLGFSDPDAGDTLQKVRITALPANAVLRFNGSLVIVNQEIDVADINAGKLTFRAEDNTIEFVQADIGVQLSDGHAFGPVQTLHVTAFPRAIAPTLVAGNVSGGINIPFALTITAAPVDPDGSETVTITIAGVPTDVLLSAGIDNVNGTWTLTLGELTGLTLTAPTASTFQLTVTATSTETLIPATASSTVFIQVSVTGPTITALNVPVGVDEGTAVSFNATATDADPALTYDWIITGPNGFSETRMGAVNQFTPPDDGIYEVTLTVTNSLGQSARQMRRVHVQGIDPTVDSHPQGNVDEGSPYSLSITFNDPGFGPSETFSAVIYWGDGSAIETGNMSNFVPGSAGFPSRGTITGSHTYADNGSYTVIVIVRDDDDQIGYRTFTVVVGNVPPTLIPSVSTAAIGEGQLLVLPEIATFSDPGFRGTSTDETFTYSIDWNDGSPLDTGSASVTTPGGVGTLTRGAFGGSHTYAQNGTYPVIVTLADDDGGSRSFTFTVNVTNGAPQLVSVSVPGTGQEATAIPLSASATDSPSDTLTYTWAITGPGGFSTTLVGDSVTFTPPDNGSYSVSLTVFDGTDSVTSTGHTIVVSNRNPAINTFNVPGTGSEGSPVSLSAAASDPAGAADPLTYTWTITGPNGFSTSATGATAGFTPPDEGTYTVNLTVTDDDSGSATSSSSVIVGNVTPTIGTFTVPSSGQEGTAINLSAAASDVGTSDSLTYAWTITGPGGFSTTRTGASVSFTPPDDGTFNVSLTVSDGDGGSATQSASISVANVAPTLTLTGPASINEGSTYTLNLGSSDPGSDTIQGWTIDWGDGTTSTVGAVSTATHVFSNNAMRTISATATDEDGTYAAGNTVAVQVNNVAPQFTNLTTTSIAENGTTTLTITLADPSSVDTYTLSVNWGDPLSSSNVESYSIAASASGSQTVAFTHQYLDDNAADSFSIQLALADGDDTATASVAVQVSNADPVAVINNAPTSSPEGTALNLASGVTDAGTLDTFTYAWTVTKNGNAYAADNTANLTFTPDDDGTYVVTLDVIDDDGGTSSTNRTITVTNAAPTPSIDSISATRQEGTAITAVGSATDPAGNNDTLTYAWSVFKGASLFVTGSGSSITFTPDDDGSYRIELTVSDEDGGSTTVSQTIVVVNVSPASTIDSISPVRQEGMPITVTGSGLDAPGVTDTVTLTLNVPSSSGVKEKPAVDPLAYGLPFLVTLQA